MVSEMFGLYFNGTPKILAQLNLVCKVNDIVSKCIYYSIFKYLDKVHTAHNSLCTKGSTEVEYKLDVCDD